MAVAAAMASCGVVEGLREMGNGIWLRFSVRRHRGGLILAWTNLVWVGIQKGRKFWTISKTPNPTEKQDFRFSLKILAEKFFLGLEL